MISTVIILSVVYYIQYVLGCGLNCCQLLHVVLISVDSAFLFKWQCCCNSGGFECFSCLLY